MRIPRGCGLSNKENILIILEVAPSETCKIGFKGLRVLGFVAVELIRRYAKDF
jgi:hypothetical protein